ncbi:oxidoreductase [Panicum miliaceum]|uniref:Oxidoreductase n=1 Tax=Panicum miliaceum TaxID=4540 RepID=A0A3L6TP67_PANMI|nr:oxidoreductase [Panicum miliaceum]
MSPAPPESWICYAPSGHSSPESRIPNLRRLPPPPRPPATSPATAHPPTTPGRRRPAAAAGADLRRHNHAVGSRSEAKAHRFVAENGLDPGAVRAHGSYETLLDDPGVDAVYVPLPTSLHVRWAAAAARGKHVLLEKPAALCAADLDAILAACEAAGVQFTDSTMAMHHPRTDRMREINSVVSFRVNDDFLQNDVKVKPDLDALGALGDIGWYCIRAILWTVSYELPRSVVALLEAVRNDAGVLLACGASMHWPDGRVATFTCSFLASLTMDVTVVGTNGTLRVADFVFPFDEKSAGFSVLTNPRVAELAVGWGPQPAERAVATDLPQEALMVREFARLVRNVRDAGGRPESKWPDITRKTQAVIDAVKASIDKGLPIEIMG